MIYLIAHKYCGEPTFDIATQRSDGTWLLNDGHLAYPYAYWQLEDLADVSDYPHVRPWTYDDKMPDDARDAYEITPRINKQKVMASLDDLLDLL